MRWLLTLLSMLLFASAAFGQGFSSRNGRNHPELKWQVAETAHFEIMYPQRLQGIEVKAAPIAEASYQALSANLETHFEDKIRIYLSDEDEISNGFAVPVGNGFTNIWVNLNDYADIWTGEVKWLRKVLAHELAHIFHYRATKGNIGVWQYVLGNPIPSFWTEGLAQYETERWDSQRGDRWLRRAVFDDQMNYEDGQSIINGRLKYAVGNAQLRFFTETYGDSALTNLLDHRNRFLWWEYHDFRDAFSAVTNTSYESFYDSWRKHMNVYYNTLAGQMQRTDSLNTDPTPIPGRFLYDVAFSPDGSRYAVLSLPSMKRPVRRLYLVQNDSTRRSRILAEGGINDDLNWSREGRRIFYSRQNRAEHGSIVNDLYLYNLASEEERRLTYNRRARYPVSGPDGQKLAFVVNEGMTSNIYLMDFAEGTEKKLTSYQNDVQLLHLAWNYKRNELIFHRFDGEGNRQLVARNMETGEELLLDANSIDNRMPVISPDGRSVAFTSLRDEVPNVFVYDFNAGTTRRLTHQVTGAEAYDWMAPADSQSYGRVAVKASEKKNRDYLYLIADTASMEVDPPVEVPESYVTWRSQSPPQVIPYHISADPSLIEDRYSYRSFSNLTHVFSFGLPYYGGRDAYGLFGMTSWVEPLGKHAIVGGGNISLSDFEQSSYGVLTYINNQYTPTVALSAYKIPGTGRFYGSNYLIEELTGGEIKAVWPVDWFNESYRADRFGIRLRHVLVSPAEEIELYGDKPLSLPEPGTARQTDLQLSWITKKQRPYAKNLLHPLDGYGLRLLLSGSEKILGSETSFFTPDVSAYKILPGPGLHRIFLYGRFQAQFGNPLPQDYIGFSRYGSIAWPVPEGNLALPHSKVERVRGYKSFIAGKRVAFASMEYRIPLLPSLGTSLLGLIRLNETSLALFTDAGAVWDVSLSDENAEDRRWGSGVELKNAVQVGPLKFVHSLGIAQPTRELFSSGYDLYYQIKASVPF